MSRTVRRSSWRRVSRPARSDGGMVRGDVGVAEVAGHLLDHVDLGGGVGPEAGDRDVQLDIGVLALHAEPDGREQVADLGGLEVGAQHGVHPGGAQLHPGRAGQVAPGVDHVGGELRAGRRQQLGEAAGGQLGDLGVGPPLEAGRRLAAQVQPLGRAGHRHRIPPGQLQQHRRWWCRRSRWMRRPSPRPDPTATSSASVITASSGPTRAGRARRASPASRRRDPDARPARPFRRPRRPGGPGRRCGWAGPARASRSWRRPPRS